MTAFTVRGSTLRGDALRGTGVVSPPVAPPTVIERTVDTEDLLNFTRIGQRVDSVRWELLDNHLHLTGVIEPDADHVPTIEVSGGRRSCQGFVLPWDQADDVDTLTSRVRVVYVLENRAEFHLGVFLFADDNRLRHSLGRDLVAVLDDQLMILDQVEGRSVTVGPGRNIGQLLVEEYVAAGIESYHVDATQAMVPDPGLTWRPDDSRLKRMTDLGDLAGFFPPYFDADGMGVSRTAVEPMAGSGRVHYDDASFARVYPGSIVESSDLLSAPNRWRVNSTSATDVPVFGEYVVPASAPHSFQRRGFYVTQAIDAQVTDSLQANEIARSAAARAGAGFQFVEFDAAPDPRHDVWMLVDWFGATYLELDWRLSLSPGGSHHHKLRRAWTA